MSQFTHAQNITELDKKINAYVARGYEPNELTVFTAQPVPELLQKYSGLNEAIITDETTDASVFKDFTDEELTEVLIYSIKVSICYSSLMKVKKINKKYLENLNYTKNNSSRTHTLLTQVK